MTLSKKTLVFSVFLLSLMSLYPISEVGAIDYGPPWSWTQSNYKALIYPTYLNSANARASASGGSVSVWAYSVSWVGGAGAIAVAVQSYRFVAPKTGNFWIAFSYQVGGQASFYGANPGPIVNIGGGFILGGLDQALETLAEKGVSEIAEWAIVKQFNLNNWGVQAYLTFDFATTSKQYMIYSNQRWGPGILYTWETVNVGSSTPISDSATVYLVKGQTYMFSAILTVWSASAAFSLPVPGLYAVGSLIMISGTGLTKLSIYW